MKSVKYKYLFFDLDHTLWDFDTNSKLALKQIFDEENLVEKGIENFPLFYKFYKPVNEFFWSQYHNKCISKEQLRAGRFYRTLEKLGIEDWALAERISGRYIEISPSLTNLFPEAIETLTYLQKDYPMCIITNGFKEVQHYKILHSGLIPFFDHIIISEEVGFQKPMPEIFKHAMQLFHAKADECLMIGDNIQTDILGAKEVGIDQVYFNPDYKRRKERVTFEIRELNELKEFL